MVLLQTKLAALAAVEMHLRGWHSKSTSERYMQFCSSALLLLICTHIPAITLIMLPFLRAKILLKGLRDTAVASAGTLGQIQNHPDHPAASLTNETGIIALDLSYLQNELTREVAQSSLHSSRLAGPFAIKALSTIADLLIGEVVGIGTGALVDVLFGKDVPVNLAELFDDALKEVDRIGGDQIAAVRIALYAA